MVIKRASSRNLHEPINDEARINSCSNLNQTEMNQTNAPRNFSWDTVAYLVTCLVMKNTQNQLLKWKEPNKIVIRRRNLKDRK